MYVLHIELRGHTASFRVPHMFKFHRSLPLPPYTSVIGMLGAAMGKDMVIAQTLFDELNLKIGIAGTYNGSCLDTWRVLTTKDAEYDVVEREVLYKPNYHIIFAGSKSAIQICEESFRYPIFPLYLGRPDDIANAIVHPIFESEPQLLYRLRNTVVAGIPSAQIDEALFDPDDPIDSGPCTLLYRLPVRYNFLRGFAYERTADRFCDFTFIGNRYITLKTPINGYQIELRLDDKVEYLGIPLLEV